jgi:hypothetical protein
MASMILTLRRGNGLTKFFRRFDLTKTDLVQTGLMKNSDSTLAFSRVAIFLLVCGMAGLPGQLYSQQSTGMSSMSTMSATEPDPNKESSELNHHLAGYALIAIGAMVIAGYSSEKLRILQFVWPFLFVAAGVFLAAWSDAEIWPRGNLSWRFLIHHDLEAREHKVYALLLILMGITEYLRARGKLSRFWRISAFPLLALLGAGLLLFHDHGASSGASSPEARQYMVSGAVASAAPAPTPPESMAGMHHDASDPDPSSVHDQTGASTSMDHEHMSMSMPMPAHDASDQGAHSHQMSEGMVKVERQHFLFLIVGVAVALFKFMSDGVQWHRSLTLRIWPGLVTLLGVLLVFYTE